MNSLNHLSLEKEIIAELGPCGVTLNKQAPTVRRETVFTMVSRSAQLSMEFPDLLNEAGLLAASALEMEFFGHVPSCRGNTLRVTIGSVAESSRNIDPVPVEVAWDSLRSGFGYAIECGHPIIIANAASESRFRDTQLIERRIQAGIICPITYRDNSYGAVGVFTAIPRTLIKDDVLFLQSIALLLGPTRAYQDAERSLTEHSRFLSSTIDSLDAIVVLLDAEGGVMQINRACQEWGGFTLNELRGRKLWSAFFLPLEEAIVRSTLNELRTQTGRRQCEAFFMTKQGEQRRVSWTFAQLPSTTGGATYLATGIDITEQYLALEKLERFESANDDANRNDSTSQLDGMNPSTTSFDAESDGRERRRHDRRPYPCIQSVAPCWNGKLPSRYDFREVRCHDISSRGFSFLMETKPVFDELIAAFGSAESRLFLRAHVRHITRFPYDGRNVLLVGCEYRQRVRLPWIDEKSN